MGKLRNTSGLPLDTVRAAVAAVRPAGIGNIDITVRLSKYPFAGSSYAQGSGYHDTARPFVVVRVGPAALFPHRCANERSPGKGYLPIGWLYNRTEALVYTMAHELRHQWQAHHKGKRGRVWGARGQYSERDADAYAIKCLRAWRKVHGCTRTGVACGQ